MSPSVPRIASRTYGIYQRLRMWLEAIRAVATELDVLLFTPSGRAGNGNASVVRQWLASAWGIKADVALCDRQPEDRPDGFVSQYLDAYVRPALSFSRQPLFRPFQGKAQRDAMARGLDRSPDVVFLHRLHAASAAFDLPLNGARTFLDIDDVEHRRFAREVRQPPRWPLKPLLYLQVPALWWGERRAIARADRAFVCSELDQRYLRRTMRVTNVDVIPNAVPHVADRPLTREQNVLFLGTYSYSPNVVGAEYLIRDVWPLLSRLCPDARLLIAGPHVEALPSGRRPPAGVEILGWVPDLRALYARTRVLCCPIQSGGGTRIKILEATSYGVPVVSTPVGAEGLDLVPDEEIVLRSSAADIAAACADLLRDDAQARRVGAAGRRRTRALYSREAVVDRMTTILRGS